MALKPMPSKSDSPTGIRSRSQSKRRLSISTTGPPTSTNSAATPTTTTTTTSSPTCHHRNSACSSPNAICDRLSRTNMRVAQLAAGHTSPRSRSFVAPPTVTLARSSSCRLPRSATTLSLCEVASSSTPATTTTTTGRASSKRNCLPPHATVRARTTTASATVGSPPLKSRLATVSALSRSPRRALSSHTFNRPESVNSTASTATCPAPRPQSYHPTSARRRCSGVFKATAPAPVSVVAPVHCEAQFSVPTANRTSPMAILRPWQDGQPWDGPRPHAVSSATALSSYFQLPLSQPASSISSCNSSSCSNSTSSLVDSTDAGDLIIARRASSRSNNPQSAMTASLALMAGKLAKAPPTAPTVTPPSDTATPDHTLLDSPLVLSKDVSIYTSFPSLTDYTAPSTAAPCKPTKSLVRHFAANSVMRMIQSGTAKESSGILLS
ncbi:hypothetical protein H4R33_001396 [Dimargaris cristalligena]|uniref:Uncharacterized protein n=1 Tax=Dimargaris cristalligena TaxID=215637 RepID=A0A4V1J519_9FUNG|nr:hypothetical protein H4R33_001396 [Dimargaris cristalligena]RKP37519.1 hypothetical protein BJ085DRAFT_30942 [Dimargaris cristalligena]|eukprot:RKP37519.1 hypothetical protein BJ085DRAFT_30942 [Dimargaris cristalligena]